MTVSGRVTFPHLYQWLIGLVAYNRYFNYTLVIEYIILNVALFNRPAPAEHTCVNIIAIFCTILQSKLTNSVVSLHRLFKLLGLVKLIYICHCTNVRCKIPKCIIVDISNCIYKPWLLGNIISNTWITFDYWYQYYLWYEPEPKRAHDLIIYTEKNANDRICYSPAAQPWK